MASSDENRLKGWSKDDKLLFYHAIKSYGSHNIEEIHEEIPNKSIEEIKEALAFFKKIALKQEEECPVTKERRTVNNSSHVPLNSWAKLLTETFPFNELRTETATALRLIANYEDIPPAVCTNKTDFRKVYHTLANALEGKSLTEDKNVCAVIDKCITETALTSKVFLKCSSLKNALKDIRINESDLSPFIKPTENSTLSILRKILMLKSYNPMNIPEEHLKFSLLS